MKTVLVLVDIQNDYFPGGRHELAEPERAAGQARRALERFRAAGWPVFHIRHVSEKDGASFFLPGTVGAEIHALVRPHGQEPVVVKHAPNSFLGTGLEALLRAQGVEALVLCGSMSHMCIDTTVRAASDLGFAVTVLEDACTTSDLTWAGERITAKTVHGVIMAALDGTFARVMTTDEWLSAAGE